MRRIYYAKTVFAYNCGTCQPRTRSDSWTVRCVNVFAELYSEKQRRQNPQRDLCRRFPRIEARSEFEIQRNYNVNYNISIQMSGAAALSSLTTVVEARLSHRIFHNMSHFRLVSIQRITSDSSLHTSKAGIRRSRKLPNFCGRALVS